MTKNTHKPIRSTNQSTSDEKKGIYTLIGFFLLLATFFIGLGVYFVILDPKAWIATIIIFLIGLVFLFFAYMLHVGLSVEKDFESHFELNEKGLFFQKTYHKEGKEETFSIPFSSIQRVIVGNNSEYISYPPGQGKSFYRLAAIMVIVHNNGTFIEEFTDKVALKEWIARFQDKGCPLYKTEFDLRPALKHRHVDFSKLEGIPWQSNDDIPPIGEEKAKNPFSTWEHGREELENEKEPYRNKTKMWEKRVSWILFGYAFLVGALIIPQYPVDSDGFLMMDEKFIFGVLFVTVFIPFFLVFWRSYTRWYMLFIYFLIMVIGNSLPLTLASFFIDVSPLYLNNFVDNATVLLFGWVPLYFITKTIKFIFRTQPW